MKATTTSENEKDETREGHSIELHKRRRHHFNLIIQFFIRETESDRRINIFGADPLKA